MAFLAKIYWLAALLSSVAAAASPVATTALPLPSPNLVKDGGFELTSGSPWKYTGSVAQRRTGADHVKELGPGSVLGYAELTIPNQKAIYPRIAQNLTLPSAGYYTLSYQYTIASFGNPQNCLLQTGVGNASYSFTDVTFEFLNAGDAVKTYEAHYGFPGTYPLGLSFFLYCDFNPGVSMFLDSIDLRFTPESNSSKF